MSGAYDRESVAVCEERVARLARAVRVGRCAGEASDSHVHRIAPISRSFDSAATRPPMT